jgi:hypothetical protein
VGSITDEVSALIPSLLCHTRYCYIPTTSQVTVSGLRHYFPHCSGGSSPLLPSLFRRIFTITSLAVQVDLCISSVCSGVQSPSLYTVVHCPLRGNPRRGEKLDKGAVRVGKRTELHLQLNGNQRHEVGEGIGKEVWCSSSMSP